MKQLNLERMVEDILTAPYQKHSETSKAAAKEIEPDAGTQRHKLFGWLYDHGPATDQEMQEGVPMDPSTQRPRRVELVRMGIVRDSGEKRKTRSGRQAIVWEVV